MGHGERGAARTHMARHTRQHSRTTSDTPAHPTRRRWAVRIHNTTNDTSGGTHEDTAASWYDGRGSNTEKPPPLA